MRGYECYVMKYAWSPHGLPRRKISVLAYCHQECIEADHNARPGQYLSSQPKFTFFFQTFVNNYTYALAKTGYNRPYCLLFQITFLPFTLQCQRINTKYYLLLFHVIITGTKYVHSEYKNNFYSHNKIIFESNVFPSHMFPAFISLFKCQHTDMKLLKILLIIKKIITGIMWGGIVLK